MITWLKYLALLVAVFATSLSSAAPSTNSSAEMVQIPAGVLLMGSKDGDADEKPVHQVKINAFLLDKFEVTQASYQVCVRAGVCARPKKFFGVEGAQLPVVGVSWEEAAQFCKFAGKRLPTEAEWEWAARGADGRSYPWGNSLDCQRANFGVFESNGPCAKINPGRVIAVGSRPAGASPFGAQDMAGNVWEWVADDYQPYAASISSAIRQAKSYSRKVVRGGSCCSYFALPKTTNRLAFPPDYRDVDLGFRCAK